jgi:putative Mn2+ efflux pump MntP
MMTLWTILGLGLVVGAQHALEPDHLAAVGTLLPEASSWKRSALRGAWWGLGHGLAIALVSAPLIYLGAQVPEHLESWAELAVAVMLLALGARALWRAWRRHEHTPKARHAAHAAPVGLLHGLAGSGAAVVLATSQAPSVNAALVFLGVFILGSTLSMATTAAVVTLPLRRLGQHRGLRPWLLGGSGLLSVVVGLFWGAPHLMG